MPIDICPPIRPAVRRFARASYFAALFLGYCSLARFYPSPALLLARECRARILYELACGLKELAAVNSDTSPA